MGRQVPAPRGPGGAAGRHLRRELAGAGPVVQVHHPAVALPPTGRMVRRADDSPQALGQLLRQGTAGWCPRRPRRSPDGWPPSTPPTRPLVDLGTRNRPRRAVVRRKQGRQRHRRRLLRGRGEPRRPRRSRRPAPRRLSSTLVNLYDIRAVLALGARLSPRGSPVDLYARFTLHALDYPGRGNVFRLASHVAAARGAAVPRVPHPSGPRTAARLRRAHRAATSAPRRCVAEIEAAGGRVVTAIEGTGLASAPGPRTPTCAASSRPGADRRTGPGAEQRGDGGAAARGLSGAEQPCVILSLPEPAPPVDRQKRAHAQTAQRKSKAQEDHH